MLIPPFPRRQKYKMVLDRATVSNFLQENIRQEY